ncbi:MAG: hypothetical protein AAGG81_07705, partial [Chlamydiota bacterium]
AVEKVAKDVCKNLDKICEERIFLESKVAIALTRYGNQILRLTKGALLGLCLGLDVYNAIENEKGKNEVNDNSVPRGVIKGCVRFISNLILSHIEDLGTVEKAERLYKQEASEGPVNKNTDVCNEIKAERTLFMMTGGRTLIPPSSGGVSADDYLKEIGIGILQLREIEEKITCALITKFEEYVAHEPDVVNHVLEDLQNEVGKKIQLPPDFFQWSDSKKAEYGIVLAKQAAEVMNHSIEQRRHEASLRRQADQLTRYFGEVYFSWGAASESLKNQPPGFIDLTKHLNDADWYRLSGGDPSRIPSPLLTPYGYNEYSGLSAFGPEERMKNSFLKASEPGSSSTDNTSIQNNTLIPDLRRMPSEPPRPILDLYRPNPTLELGPSQSSKIPSSYLRPFGDIRIQQPGGGIGVDIAGGTSVGIGVIVSVDLLNVEISSLIASAAPIVLPIAFAAIVGLNLKAHIDRRNAERKTDDDWIEWQRESSLINLDFRETWTPIIENKVGNLSQSNITTLTDAGTQIVEQIEKVEKSIQSVNKDSALTTTTKLEVLNSLVDIHGRYYLLKQVIESRLAMETFYTSHSNDSSDKLTLLLNKPSIATDPLKRDILVQLALDKVLAPSGEESIDLDQALYFLSGLQEILPNLYSLQKGVESITILQNSIHTLCHVEEKFNNLDFRGALEKLKVYLEERNPASITLDKSKTPSHPLIPKIEVVGLDDKNTKNDLNSQKPDSPGINTQIDHINNLPFNEIDVAFLDGLIAKIQNKDKKWDTRLKEKILDFSLHSVLGTKASNSIRKLKELKENKEYWDKLQGKNFDELIALVATADNSDKKEYVQNALISTLEKEMLENSSQLHEHLLDYTGLFSDKEIDQLIGFLEARELFQPIFNGVNENPDYQELTSFFEQLKAAFPDTDISALCEEFSSIVYNKLESENVAIHNAFVGIAKGEESLSLDETREKLTQLFSVDSNRSEALYQEWCDQFILLEKCDVAESLIDDWKSCIVGDETQLLSFEKFCRIRQPFIDYQDKSLNISFRLMREHYIKESTSGEIQTEDLDALYLNTVFLPYTKWRMDTSQKLIGTLMQTVGRDFLRRPTHIPGFGNFREEKLAKSDSIVIAQRMVHAAEIVYNFEPSLFPAIVHSFRYRLPIEQKGLNTLIWENSEFTPTALKEIFWDGADWDSKKHLTALLRLAEAGLETGKLMGVENDKLSDVVSTGSTILRTLEEGANLNLITQALPGLLDGFERAFQDVTGELPENEKYHTVKKVVVPLLAFSAAYSKYGCTPITLMEGGRVVYEAKSVPNQIIEAKLNNIQKHLSEGREDTALSKLEEIENAGMRADDRDTCRQLKIAINFAKASRYQT